MDVCGLVSLRRIFERLNRHFMPVSLQQAYSVFYGLLNGVKITRGKAFCTALIKRFNYSLVMPASDSAVLEKVEVGLTPKAGTGQHLNRFGLDPEVHWSVNDVFFLWCLQ